MDTVDIKELHRLRDDKLITLRQHPQAPLWVANYSPQVQFDKLWGKSPLLPLCRGLIFDSTGKIHARPAPKFFNVGEVSFPDGPFTVSDKADGSLGLVYWIDETPYITTRGSFESDQAKMGTKLLHTLYRDTWPLLSHHDTFMFEVVGQSNQIVIHYKEDMLVLLAVINTETGAEPKVLPEIGFPTVKQHGRFNSLTEFIESLPEGATRNDLRQRIRNETGVAYLPPVQKSKKEESIRPQNPFPTRSRLSLDSGMDTAQSRGSQRTKQDIYGGNISGETAEGVGSERFTVHGLSTDLSFVRDGLRPQTGGDEALHYRSQITESSVEDDSNGDSQVRSGLLELSPASDLEEGFVLRWDDGTRLKLKTSEYLRLHKVLTGVSARTIWQALKNGDSLEAWIENVPDEFAEFIRQTSLELTEKFDEIAIKVKRDFATIMASFSGFAYPDRKQFAMEALKYKDKDILFLMYDERDWHDRVWKQVYPEAEAPAFKVEM